VIELHPAVPSVLMPGVPVDPETAEAIEYIAMLEGVTQPMLVRQALRAWTLAYMTDLNGEPISD
jgi:hypothetical protein